MSVMYTLPLYLILTSLAAAEPEITVFGGEQDAQTPLETYVVDVRPDEVNEVPCPGDTSIAASDAANLPLITWTPPEGVFILPSGLDEIISQEEGNFHSQVSIIGSLHPLNTNTAPARVEVTPRGLLVFRNPDASIEGGYLCRSFRDGRVVAQTQVFVSVRQRDGFGVAQRTKVGIIAMLTFLACAGLALAIYLVCRRDRYRGKRRRPRDINSKTYEEDLLNLAADA